jgi:hypothetical protein
MQEDRLRQIFINTIAYQYREIFDCDKETLKEWIAKEIEEINYTMDRMETILNNILIELYNNTFDCNMEEFKNWLKLEIGATDEEIEYILSHSNLT